MVAWEGGGGKPLDFSHDLDDAFPLPLLVAQDIRRSALMRWDFVYIKTRHKISMATLGRVPLEVRING